MDSYDFDVRLTPAARELLRPGEALVLDWHTARFTVVGLLDDSRHARNNLGRLGR